MKKIISIIFCSLLFINCTKIGIEDNNLSKNNLKFYENKEIMNDISKEQRYVDSLLSIEKNNFNTKSVPNHEAIPLSKEQLVRFIKCMNVCCESKGYLQMVFFNKNTNEIVSLCPIPNISEYDIITKIELFKLLREGQIEFKIIENNYNKRSVYSYPNDDDDIYTDDYIVVDRLYKSSFALPALTTLYVDIILGLKVTPEKGGKIRDSLPELKQVWTRIGTSIGTYTDEPWELEYDKNIIITTKGMYSIACDLCICTLNVTYEVITTNTIKHDAFGYVSSEMVCTLK